MSNYRKKDQKTVLEVIILGLLRGLWWLIKLPFSKQSRARGISQTERNFIIEKRLEIERQIDSSNYAELTHLLFEADKLVDYYFKEAGFSGETFADRLRAAKPSMDSETYNSLWQGHKVRNVIAHESHNISNNELKSAINKLLRYIKGI